MATIQLSDRGLEAAPGLPDWQDLFDASPFGTLLFMPDLTLLGCNAQHARTTGVSSEAMRGRFMFDVWPKNPAAGGPDTEAAIRASVARVAKTGAPDEPPIQKHDLPRADGTFEPRYWRIIHSPVMRKDAVVAIRQDSWDVTASVLETERQAALQRVAGTLAGVAYWELDAAADRLTASPEFDVLFGFPPDDGTGVERPFSTYAERFHADDRAAIETAVAELMAEGPGAVRQLECRILRPDRGVRTAVLRGERVTGAEGQHVLTGITVDVTDLHAKEERLATLLEEKEALLGEVNHRMKNSLQLVGAILNLEARTGGDDAGRLASAAARVQSVAAVHASLYHGKDVRLVEMGTHLRQFCAHLAESLGAGARGIALRVDVDDLSLPAVRAIPLSLIINELVTNAFKHAFPEAAPVGAAVTVGLHRGADGRFLLGVNDNGGMSGTGPHADESGSTPGIHPTEPSGVGGLGTRLISTLVRQIDGRITEEHNGGRRIRIEFEG